jgi:hypothetical protein
MEYSFILCAQHHHGKAENQEVEPLNQVDFEQDQVAASRAAYATSRRRARHRMAAANARPE